MNSGKVEFSIKSALTLRVLLGAPGRTASTAKMGPPKMAKKKSMKSWVAAAFRGTSITTSFKCSR
jgi:hypothetical protein